VDVLLVLHGSADEHYHEASTAFFSAWRQHRPELTSHLCFLEHAEPLFREKLAQLAAAGGCVSILPLFLHQGMHSTQDIPGIVADARQRLPVASIRMARILDDAGAIAAALAGRAAEAMPDAGAVVVLSHGAVGVEDMVRQVADLVAEKCRAAHVLPAWMTGDAARLQEALDTLMDKDVDSVVIVPHVLLAGGWAGKVEAVLDLYCRRFSAVRFILAEPLGAHPVILSLMDARLAGAGA